MAKKIFDSLDDLGRFSEPALMILISLAEGPKHGYAMTQDIEAMSGLKLGPGTLTAPSRGSRSAVDRPLAEDRRRPCSSRTPPKVLRARLGLRTSASARRGWRRD